MAQIIKHRRGSLEALSAATGSFQKGELIIISGSSNITSSNGSGLLFAAVESGSVQAVNRFLIGDNAPNTFPANQYNGLLKGVPYYASGSSTLYLLGSGGNDAINLVGNIQPFSQSVDSRLSTVEASLGGGGSIGSRVAALETSSANLNAFSSSQLTQNSNLATYTGSVENRLTQVGVVSGSLIASASAASVSIANLNASSASQQVSIDNLNSFSSSANTRFTEIGIVSGSLISSASAAAVADANQNLFTASANTRFTEIGVVSGSLISSASAASVSISNINSFTQSFSQSVATSFSASAASVSALSASVASVTGDFSSSVATSFSASNAARVALSQSVSASFAGVAADQSAQNTRIDGLANLTGSYATTGSNTFYGNQVITGSVYINANLVVQGSSSLQNITASAVSIGTNTVVLNTNSPAVRFAGISVYDSGSSQTTGSLWWDSLNNVWLYQNPSGSGYTSAKLISGPQNSGSLGNEGGLTAGKLVVAVGDDHIGDSIITQATDNSKVTIGGGLDVTGEISSSTIAGLGNATAFSTSVDSRLDVIEGSLGSGGSIGSRVSALETSSANVNSFTSSQLTQNSNLATYTGSVENRLSEIGVVSGSLISSASAAAIANANQNLFTASANTSISNLNTFSSSVNTRLTEVGVVTGSLISSASAAAIANANLNTFSASANTSISNLNTFSASVNTSISALNSSSASQQTSLDNLNAKTGSYATTGSNTFIGTQTVSGSFNVSGSANFNGAVAVNDSNMNLTNSSSLNLTSGSSIYVNGPGTISGSITGIGNVTAFSSSVDARLNALSTDSGSQAQRLSSLETFSSSVNTQLTQVGVVTGSLISSASAASISIAALNSYTASNTSTNALNAFTASAETRFTEIGVVSGSLIASASTAKTTNDAQDTSISNLNTFSASVNTRLSEVGVVTGSLIASASADRVSITNLNLSSASQQVSIDNLNSFSSSANTRFTEIGVVSGSLISSASSFESRFGTLATYTGSVNTRLTEIGVVTASLIASASAAAAANSNINSFTASANTRLSNLETTSASVNTSLFNINSFTESADVRLDNLELKSASVDTSIYNINGATASLFTSVANLNSTTASLNTSVFNLNSFSSSALGRLSNLESTSASVNSSLASINSYTSSLKTAFELTGSNVVVLGDLTVKGTTTSVQSTTVQLGDNIIELNGTGAANGGLLVKDPTAPNTVSGSLLWDSTNDYWKAGALGSESKLLRAAGDSVVSGSSQIDVYSTTNFSSFNSALQTVTGSLISSASAAKTTNDAQDVSISNLNSNSASVNVSIAALNSYTSSNTSTNALNAYTASAESRFTEIGVVSGSLIASASAAKTTNDAQGVSITNLNSFTSSINTTIKTKLDAEGVISGSSQLTSSYDARYILSGSITQTTWDNISGKPNGLVSGSSQVDITATTGFNTFSASIETRISIIDGGTY